MSSTMWMKAVSLEVVEPHAELVTFRKDPNWASKALGLIEECGRVSHKSEGRIQPGSDVPFVRKVGIEWGHESILEHTSFTACLVGSRSMSHQLVRHRIAAYTQESQRFCDYSDAGTQNRLKIVVPPSIGTPMPGSTIRILEGGRACINVSHPSQPVTDDLEAETPLWRFCWDAILAYSTYLALRESGIPAEDAREVLPNCTKTEVYTTFNLREWRHVFRMRLDKHSQWQIKKVVREVYDHFREVCPVLVEGLRTHSGEEIP